MTLKNAWIFLKSLDRYLKHTHTHSHTPRCTLTSLGKVAPLHVTCFHLVNTEDLLHRSVRKARINKWLFCFKHFCSHHVMPKHFYVSHQQL